jgi:hypothetical protein
MILYLLMIELKNGCVVKEKNQIIVLGFFYIKSVIDL